MGELDDQLRRLADQRTERISTTSAATALATRPPSGANVRWWVAAAAMLAVLAGTGAWLAAGDGDDAGVAGTTTTVPPSSSVPALPNLDDTQVLLARNYGVQVVAPIAWSEIEPGRTWGDDSGFVAIDVAPDGSAVQSAVQVALDAERVLGATPLIEDVIVAGQPAVRLTGTDEATEDVGTFVYVVTVVELPSPITIRDASVSNIVVASDIDHHDQILASLQWLEPNDPTPPVPNGTYDAAAAGPEGIDLRRPGTHEIDHLDAPGLTGAEIAFVLPGPLVVFQSGLSGLADRVLHVTSGAGTDLLASGQIQLLDAAVIDGTPTALFARRTGDSPETADVRLTLLDLNLAVETDLGRFGGWESGVADARLGDGAIAVHLAAEGFEWIEVIDYAGELQWSTEAEWEQRGALALDGESVIWVDVSVPGGTNPLVRWWTFDLRSGEFIGVAEREFADATFDFEDDRRCDRPEWGFVLWCNVGRGEQPPQQLDLETGVIEPVPGFSEGLVTRTKEVSATPPVPHPCGRANPAYPNEVWPHGTYTFDDGTQIELVAFVEDDIVGMQGIVNGRHTNRVTFPYLGGWVEAIVITEPGGSEVGVLFNDSGTPDFIAGQIFRLIWDGCELTAVSAGVIN